MAPESGLATVGVHTYFVRVSVWTGTSLANLADVAELPFEPLFIRPTFQAVAGQTYWIQVAEEGYAGPFTLDWSIERPPNDDFAAARVISDAVSSTSGLSMVRATAEPGEPELWPGRAAARSVWLRWTAPYTGSTEFQVASGVCTLSVFRGDALTALTRIGGATATMSVSFTAQAGVTYMIRIEGTDDQAGVMWEQRWDTTAPTAGVRADRTLATTRWVGLTLSGADSGSGVLGWYVSNHAPIDGLLITTAWVPASSPMLTWSLTHTAYGGRPVNGLKHVYVQAIDRQGNRSAPVSVAVTLDR